MVWSVGGWVLLVLVYGGVGIRTRLWLLMMEGLVLVWFQEAVTKTLSVHGIQPGTQVDFDGTQGEVGMAMEVMRGVCLVLGGGDKDSLCARHTARNLRLTSMGLNGRKEWRG